MNRTSRDTERRVFQLHFEGDSNYTISLKLEIPKSTVSDILSLLPESIAPLQDLSKDLKKHNLTVFEAKKGTQLNARLADLGVSSLDQLESLVESAEKVCTNPDYTPKQIVQAAMRLSDLEEITGKSYSETLLDFEEKKDDIKALEAMENQLNERVGTLKTELKRMLAKNNNTEKEIAYIADLRQNLDKYDVRLDDFENLRKYLENMRETGADPRTFVKYTQEHGSLIGRIASLQQEEQEHKLNLQSLKEKEKLAQNALNRSLSKKSELDKQNNEEEKKLLAIRNDVAEAQRKYGQELAKLGQLLNAEARAEKFSEALEGRESRLCKLDAEIDVKRARLQSLKQRAQELDDKNKNVEHEIEAKLKIKDYATQLSAGLIALTKEIGEKKEKIAVADTTTAFLTKQTSYDFNRFYSYVEQIKTMRESRTYQTSLHLAVAEEQTRARSQESKSFVP